MSLFTAAQTKMGYQALLRDEKAPSALPRPVNLPGPNSGKDQPNDLATKLHNLGLKCTTL